MLIGIDVHKRLVNITGMEEDGTIRENYEIENSEEAWNAFTERYLSMKPEIALEQPTSGKYVARLLRDKGFSVHIADPVKLALIYISPKKGDKEDSYKLAKLLRLGELPEVHLPSQYSDDLRPLVRYKKSLGEEVTMIKNRIHADRTYVRDDYQLQGWMFVNFIALMLHYRIYNLLRKREMLRHYSPRDVIEHLERISRLKIGDEWKYSEIPKKSRKIMDDLDLHIVQN